MSVINTHIFGRFMSVSCTITQRFGDPEGFARLINPGVHLCVCRQHSQFWPILTCFVDYYSRFWGPEAISIVVELQGVLTCWSSTLAVLADSGPFHGLLLTVLGSQSDFHGCRIPRCAYMSVINNHSLGRFWPVSWTITLFWGLGVISMIDEPLVRLRVGHQHSHIRPILVRFVHYHSAFWGPRAISTIDEPRGSFMCPSSTLRVLANSDGFRGLLLTVLGSRSDFHSC